MLNQYPNKYQDYINPSITHLEILDAMPNYRYGINLSTVKDSETMVARRVFEMALAKNLIISNNTK